jgi:hypothetical protein
MLFLSHKPLLNIHLYRNLNSDADVAAEAINKTFEIEIAQNTEPALAEKDLASLF